MGQTNQGPDKGAAFMETIFNLGNDVPTESGWNISTEDLKKKILKCVRDFIPDFQSATIEVNPATGAVIGYVWLSMDSNHIVDNSLINDSESMIKQKVLSESQDLKNFANRFCPRGRNRLVQEDVERGQTPKRCALMIDITKVLAVYYDVDGRAFEKKYGYMPPKCELFLEPRFGKKDSHNNARFEGIHVIKKVKSFKDNSEPRPKKSFKN